MNQVNQNFTLFYNENKTKQSAYIQILVGSIENIRRETSRICIEKTTQH